MDDDCGNDNVGLEGEAKAAQGIVCDAKIMALFTMVGEKVLVTTKVD